MTTLLIVIAAGFVLAIVSLIIGYRLTKPHSRKLGQQQAHINSRAGGHQPAPAPAAPAAAPTGPAAATAAAPATAPAPKPPVKDAIGSLVWTGVLVIAALATLFWIRQNPEWGGVSGVSKLKDLVWDNWLSILVAAGFLWAIVELSATWLGSAAHVLRLLLRWGIPILFIGSLVLSWWFTPTQKVAVAVQRPPAPMAQRVLPQDAPDLPWAWKLEKSKWPRVHVPPHGNSVRVPGIFGGHVVWGGSGFKVHCVYADGREGIVGDPTKPCNDGDIVESYARNDGDTPIYAAYAYARAGEK